MRMCVDVSEAKAFLLQQTIEQAAVEGVDLSGNEIRLLSFTEEPDPPDENLEQEDELSDKDDSSGLFDTRALQSKVARLMSRAYVRIRKESETKSAMWDASIACLQESDDYIAEIWEQRHARADRVKDLFKLAGIGLALLTAILSLVVLASRMGVGSKSSPGISGPLPGWLQHAILGLIVSLYLGFLLLPRQFAAAFDKIVSPISKLFEHKPRL